MDGFNDLISLLSGEPFEFNEFVWLKSMVELKNSTQDHRANMNIQRLWMRWELIQARKNYSVPSHPQTSYTEADYLSEKTAMIERCSAVSPTFESIYGIVADQTRFNSFLCCSPWWREG
jgi:hypothetical protein